MIHILNQLIKINLVFLFMMVIVSIHAMKNQTLVHPALLDSLGDIENASTFGPGPQPSALTSLIDCLRDNHHVQVCYKKATSAETKGRYVLEFTTYGQDALQWIIPNSCSKNDEEAAWKELSEALRQIISRRSVVKIVFKIQPESPNRLEKIKRYSCLMHPNSVFGCESLQQMLPVLTLLQDDKKIEYRNSDIKIHNNNQNCAIYYTTDNVLNNQNIKINLGVTLEKLPNNTLDNGFFVTEHGKKAKNISGVTKKESHTFFYVVCGGAGLAVLFIGWLYV